MITLILNVLYFLASFDSDVNFGFVTFINDVISGAVKRRGVSRYRRLRVNDGDGDTGDDDDVHDVNALKFPMSHLFTNSGQCRLYLPERISECFIMIEERIL